ncbi:MAG: TolA-binding protein [bacterium]|jgi:TolA-binding protein
MSISSVNGVFASAVLNQIQQLSYNKKTSFLTFHIKGQPEYEIFENLAKRVLVIRFRNAKVNPNLYNNLKQDNVLGRSDLQMISTKGYSITPYVISKLRIKILAKHLHLKNRFKGEIAKYEYPFLKYVQEKAGITEEDTVKKVNELKKKKYLSRKQFYTAIEEKLGIQGAFKFRYALLVYSLAKVEQEIEKEKKLINAVNGLQGKKFLTQSQFLSAIQKKVGYTQTQRFKSTLLKFGHFQNEFAITVRTKSKNTIYKLLPQKKSLGKLVFRFYRETLHDNQKTFITRITRDSKRRNDRFEISLTRKVQYEIREIYQPKYQVQVKFLNTMLPGDIALPRYSSRQVRSIETSQKSGHLVLHLYPRGKKGLKIKDNFQKNPLRLILDIQSSKRKSKKTITESLLKSTKVQKKNEKKLQLEARLKALTANAEKIFRRGQVTKASQLFKQVYRMAPKNEIGVKARFRAADAYYHRQVHTKKATGYYFVIQEYEAAMDAAEIAGLTMDDTTRAIFNIGKSYLALEYYDESLREFSKILRKYPKSKFAEESTFHQGIIQFNRGKYEESTVILKQFQKKYKDSRLYPIALYKYGEASFYLKRYKLAKDLFDQARSLNTSYLKHAPKLMFNMGEAYFENEDYDTARSIYEDLIASFPRETFSNFVAIRIGDMLRKVGKDEDAIKAYEKAINTYPKESWLIGKMRIANILASRPSGDSYKKAIQDYDLVITRHPFSSQAKEAVFRKALTLSLFRRYPEAIEALDAYQKKYPKDQYVLNKAVRERILENIYASIYKKYLIGKHFETIAVYEKYQKRFLDPLPANLPLFLLGDSYYQLGLDKPSEKFFNLILLDKKHPMAPVALLNKAKMYEKRGKYAKAERAYKDFILDYPNHMYAPTVHKTLADMFVKMNQIQKAKKHYENTILVYQNQEKKKREKHWNKFCTSHVVQQQCNPLIREVVPKTYFALGNLYRELGLYQKSVVNYKKVLDEYTHPINDPKVEKYILNAQFLIGDMYFELDQIPQAMKAYQSAIGLYPNSEQAPWAKYQIGQIYRKQDKKSIALKIFTELTEAAKKQPKALWGRLAKQSKKEIENAIRFDKYLSRKPSAAATGG